ncbi:MAG: type II toxin-antitoxin system RelE/ParE family toxin [Elusimicrobia bacterium]|nr:type II toxin-antitoxin system RelE/ParE family toxin [Elusimicrobiota bacterium]
MNMVWQPRAKRHLGKIREYIKRFNPTVAAAMAERIVTSAGAISSCPQIGKAGRVPDTRELAVAGTPYIIVYRVRDGVIVVLSVLHGAQVVE